jgi:hypothetical protein
MPGVAVCKQGPRRKSRPLASHDRSNAREPAARRGLNGQNRAANSAPLLADLDIHPLIASFA